jgi:hypothetical protein
MRRRDRLSSLPREVAIAKAAELLEIFPSSCRKAVRSGNPFLRELIISFGGSGCVAWLEKKGPRG